MTFDLSRRTLLGLTPTLATLIVTEGALVLEAQAQDKQAQRISKEQLKAAMEVLGLDFTDAQRDMMLPGVNRALGTYENLRKISIPLDTEPAIHFHPALPGKEPKPRASKFAPTKISKLPTFSKVEDLAFLSATELGALVQARKVTSTDLTKIYLDRLKKYSPKLLNVVTLTDQLALEQAARADQEIAAGKYRGPLHGIPY